MNPALVRSSTAHAPIGALDALRALPERLRALVTPRRWPAFRTEAPRAVTALMLGSPTLAVRVEAATSATGGAARLAAAVAAGDSGALRGWKSDRLFAGSQALLVLRTAERQLMTLDQPQVEDGELAIAARWPLAEAMECDAEAILATALPLPRINDAQRTQMLAIGARVAAVRGHLEACRKAGIAVGSIDIADSALRGMALLHGGSSDAAQVVLTAVGSDICIGLLWRGSFCALRTLSLAGAAPRDAAGFEEQLALHLQRTTDTFERQATQLAVRRSLALLPSIAAASRDAVRSMLPLQAEWFNAQAAFEVADGAAQALAEHEELAALACVAAARLLDRRTVAARAEAEPAEALA